MPPKRSPTGRFASAAKEEQRIVGEFFRRNRALVIILLVLVTAAVGSRIVQRADLLGGGGNEVVVTASSQSSEQATDTYACTSKGSPIFEKINKPADAIQAFRDNVAAVVTEREELLATPSKWKCSTDSPDSVDPDMPVLRNLAGQLPGWRERSGPNAYTLRPVTFASFSAILTEFEREYECKLAEFQDQTVQVVGAGNDGDGTQKPIENLDDFRQRGYTHYRTMKDERQRARVALERTIATLRSYELMVPLTTRLQCLVRAQMDLKNELSLLADTMSCIPRIWDAATSLHDRSPTSPLERKP